jgi:DNA replication and repair protein RecF
VHEAYNTIAGQVEEPTIDYCPSVSHAGGASEEEVRALFAQALRRKVPEERRLGLTLVGPHRDELDLAINGLGVRSHASQGQHKTFLIALKIAEFLYLQKTRNEQPILLLDDMFTELDSHRSERLLMMTQTVGQAFVTATNGNVFSPAFQWSGGNKRFFVHNGTVDHENEGSRTQ